jgi:hypothetical protein
VIIAQRKRLGLAEGFLEFRREFVESHEDLRRSA